MSYLVNLSFTTGESPKFCKIAKVIPLFKKVILLIVLIINLYRYYAHSLKYLKKAFTSVFTLFLGRKILSLSVSLASGQVVLLMIQ